MTTSRLASLRLALAASLALTSCSTAETPRTPQPQPSSAGPGPTETAAPTPAPTPTPEPTPRFVNRRDEALAGLIPTTAAEVEVVVAPFDEFALTPGDVGLAYGEIGARFASLAVAFVAQPRTTLYAMRVEGAVTTEELEPHLPTAGRYVGIAGLDPDPWELTQAGGHQVWARPEDDATAAGTIIYTWSSGEVVFLLIGVNDTVNRAIIEQLPGEPAPSPSPTPRASASSEPTESQGG